MAIENPLKSNCVLRVNAGTRPSNGAMITKTVSIGKVMAGADVGKIMAVVALMLPVIEYPLVRVERTEVTVIEN